MQIYFRITSEVNSNHNELWLILEVLGINYELILVVLRFVVHKRRISKKPLAFKIRAQITKKNRFRLHVRILTKQIICSCL